MKGRPVPEKRNSSGEKPEDEIEIEEGEIPEKYSPSVQVRSFYVLQWRGLFHRLLVPVGIIRRVVGLSVAAGCLAGVDLSGRRSRRD